MYFMSANISPKSVQVSAANISNKANLDNNCDNVESGEFESTTQPWSGFKSWLGGLEVVFLNACSLRLSVEGCTVNGLRLHPDDIHIVYPLGSKVVIQNWETKHQSFLSGHTNIISSIDISPNGKYVASGQINHMGFKSSVIVWDFEKRELHAKHEIHKVRVECVAFSCDSVYLVSLGGRDDSNIIVWDVEARDAMCGNLSNTGTSGDAAVLCTTNQRGLCFVSGGINNLRVWTINPKLRNLQVVEVALGMIRRNIRCMVIDERDDFLFCGSTTGDIMKVKLNYSHDVRAHEPVKKPVLLGCYGKYGGKKKLLSGEPSERFRNGVTALLLLPKDLEDRMVVGAGDGTVEMVREKEVCLPKGSPIRIPSLPQLRVLKSTNVNSGVTSLILNGELLFAGTQLCEIHTVHVQTFDVVRHTTCHTNAIFGIAFPYNYSEVFATGSKEDIRVWNTISSQELLRICVDNFTCSSLQFTQDGTAIVSGWNDGVIRSFTPQTGRLIFAIHNAHYRGVSAIAITSRGDTIVSGGGEGQVISQKMPNGSVHSATTTVEDIVSRGWYQYCYPPRTDPGSNQVSPNVSPGASVGYITKYPESERSPEGAQESSIEYPHVSDRHECGEREYGWLVYHLGHRVSTTVS
uniref:Cilia- and flagella-associated protein 52 n=1 Tax=Timema monikensis TaxID=170555 RepID=A0A7R9EHM0_9NEOP|nr:unnamed protein product [Timema monikensis]